MMNLYRIRWILFAYPVVATVIATVLIWNKVNRQYHVVIPKTQTINRNDLSQFESGVFSESVQGMPTKTERNGETQRNGQYIKYNNFTKMNSEQVYVFGTTLGNTTDTATWDIIKVHASVSWKFRHERMKCCVKYNTEDGPVYYRKHTLPVLFNHRISWLLPFHYTCWNPKPGVVPDGIALSLQQRTCEEGDAIYRKPIVPLREPGDKLALCTKLIYGERSAELVIEFMETYKYLGVDKFVTYFIDSLNEDARKVLEYYASTGVLDLYYFEPAHSAKVKRHYNPPNTMTRFDNQLLIFDAFERMSGYSYFGIIDFDEFLIPSKNRSLKELLADLYSEYSNAAGFTFRSQHFFTNWGAAGTVNDMMLGRHITTTTMEPKFYAKKSIYKPKYMDAGRIHTHKPKSSNRTAHPMIMTSSDVGFIRHFRKCYTDHCEKHWGKPRNDTWLAEWSNRIRDSVQNVRYRVFGSYS